ncbi:MAG: SDR family oxidoreductase [Planctomycetaceae bacterium]
MLTAPTGTTGFPGACLLDELLHRTEATIVCLVRASNEAAGRRRLMNNLKRYSLTPPDLEERVRIVVGDFSKPAFGLSCEPHKRLAAEIDVIYHNGADFNLALCWPLSLGHSCPSPGQNAWLIQNVYD